MSAQLFTAA